MVFLRNGRVFFLLQVAQYASDAGEGKSATEAVDECLRYKMLNNSLYPVDPWYE